MVAPRFKHKPKPEPIKYLGYVCPSDLPVKVGDKVIIPQGVKLIKPNSWTSFPNFKEVEATVARISPGKSYKNWNKHGTDYELVNVENPRIGFKTDIGILLVDINDIKLLKISS